MIVLENVTKFYETPAGRHYVLRDINLTIQRGKHLGVLGRNGAGKSTFLRLLSGAEQPNEGEITRSGSVSWPLGLVGGFQGNMTGMENAEFVCRIHGLDAEQTQALIDFAYEFSELGDYFHMPITSYSSGMRGRLRFALSLAFKFDYYLVDELTSVGDAIFRRKAKEAFQNLRERASILFASHSFGALQNNCDAAIVISNGGITYFESVRNAIKAYKRTLRGMPLHEE